MGRIAAFIYGLVSAAIAQGAFLYLIGFAGNFVVPRSVDSGGEEPAALAWLANVALLALFGLQHSVMARPGFKRRWSRVVPEPVERSTYVLIASLLLLLLFWQWRPLPAVIWSIENLAGRMISQALFLAGWLLVFLASSLMAPYDFLGLRQVYMYLRRRPCSPLGFRTPGLYNYVRHPDMLGLLIAFWATPVMTAGHLLFAATATAYILTGIQFEERDLARSYGEAYRRYRQQVPMLLPGARRS